MTKDDVIRMAREAGPLTQGPFEEWCKRFAALVAEREREECVRMCNEADKSTHPADLAEAIRARGENT